MTDSNNRALARNENPQVVDPPGVTPGGLRGLAHTIGSPLWRPLVVRTASVAAGMLGLAGIGMFTTLSEIEGGVPPAELAEASTWLAGNLSLPARADRPTTRAVTTPATDTARALVSPVDSAPAHDRTEAPEPDAVGQQGASEQEDPTKDPPGLTADGKVILNTATPEQLQRLPGVGEKRARKIVALRERLGRFRRATDLLRVRGIGVKSLRKMLPHLVLDPPAPLAPPAPAPSADPDPSKN